jgi:hypothetical protein
MNPNFNPEITLGNLITLGGLLLAALGGFYGIKSNLQLLQQRLGQYIDALVEHKIQIDRRVSKVEENDRRVTEIVARLLARMEERDRWDGRTDRRNGHGNGHHKHGG